MRPERTALVCALLALVAVAHRARSAAFVLAATGLTILVLDAALATRRPGPPPPCRRETYAADPEPTTTATAAVNSTDDHPMTDPDPDANQGPQEDAYRRGLVVADHSGRPDWHRFAAIRPPANRTGDRTGDPQADDRARRNRLLYRVPLAAGGYRSTTGQTSRFAIYG